MFTCVVSVQTSLCHILAYTSLQFEAMESTVFTHHGQIYHTPWPDLSHTMARSITVTPWPDLSHTMARSIAHHGQIYRTPWPDLSHTMARSITHHGQIYHTPWPDLSHTMARSITHHGQIYHTPWPDLSHTMARSRGGDIEGAGGAWAPPLSKAGGLSPPKQQTGCYYPTRSSTNLQLCHLVSWGLASLTCSAKHEGATRAHSDNWKMKAKFFSTLHAYWSALHASMHCLRQRAIVLLPPPHFLVAVSTPEIYHTPWPDLSHTMARSIAHHGQIYRTPWPDLSHTMAQIYRTPWPDLSHTMARSITHNGQIYFACMKEWSHSIKLLL